MTSSTSLRAPGVRSTMRRSFFSSSIRLTLVWRRPAVSTSTRSAPRLPAAAMASKTTEPGSAPSWPRTRSAPTRCDHSWSCSAAAARKVSAAAITTLRPDAASRWAILPMLVVFPTPLTPTNIHTLGWPGSKASDRSAARSWSTRSTFSSSSSSSGVVTDASFTRRRRSSRIRPVTTTPTSARMRASSSSFHTSSSMTVRPRSSPKYPASSARALPSRSRSRGRTGGGGGAGSPTTGSWAGASGGRTMSSPGGSTISTSAGSTAGLGGGLGWVTAARSAASIRRCERLEALTVATVAARARTRMIPRMSTSSMAGDPTGRHRRSHQGSR